MIKPILFIFVITWLWLIFLDIFFPPLEIFLVYRIKQLKNGKFKIQSRSFYSPFYKDHGIGDIAGFEFKTLEYDDYEMAVNELYEIKKM